ncbi:MAG: PAS domain S-box protein [Blastocatellia bacterium]|nr:PAS domain S-box protein [Blastocatellia bacterium]
MNAILILSIIIRLVAFIVALILLRKTRDWRMGFLALTLFLMGAYQSLALGEIVRTTGEVTFPIAKELTGLAISILALLTVLGLAALLARHRKEQHALHESHSLLQAIIESTPDAVFVKDLEGRYVMINSAGARFLEKAVEEVIGQDDTALFSPDTASQIMETDRKVRDSGEFRMYEETSTAMGVTRTYLARKGPWWDNNGNVIGLIGIATDITEGKQAEEELRASQERFSKAFYSSPYPMSIIRLRDNRFIYTNDNVVRMTGYRREEIIGHTALELNVWVDTGDRKEILRLLKEQGRVHQKDIKFRTKSGQVREGLFSAETIEVDGEPCLLTTTNDITERKRAEDALAGHAERLRALREMDQAILAARSPEEIAEVALSHLRQLLPAQGAVSVVFAFEEDEAKVLAVNADIRVSVRPGARFPIARFNRERFEKLRQGETVVVGDVEELSCVSPPIEEIRTEGVRSYVGVPLMAQGKLVGALGFGADSPQAFSESEIDLMEEVAEVLAIAIQQSRLFKAERRARRIAETLQSANLALSRTLQLDQVLEVFLTLMRELIPYDSASVMLRETETCMTVRAVRGYTARGAK